MAPVERERVSCQKANQGKGRHAKRRNYYVTAHGMSYAFGNPSTRQQGTRPFSPVHFRWLSLMVIYTILCYAGVSSIHHQPNAYQAYHPAPGPCYDECVIASLTFFSTSSPARCLTMRTIQSCCLPGSSLSLRMYSPRRCVPLGSDCISVRPVVRSHRCNRWGSRISSSAEDEEAWALVDGAWRAARSCGGGA